MQKLVPTKNKLSILLTAITIAISANIAMAASFRFDAFSPNVNVVEIGTDSTGTLQLRDGEVLDISMSRAGDAMVLELKKSRRQVRLSIPIRFFSARDMSFQRPRDEAFPWEVRGTSELTAAAPACGLDWTWFLAGPMAGNPVALYFLRQLCLGQAPQQRTTTQIVVNSIGSFTSIN
jgi:hypothetical protein